MIERPLEDAAARRTRPARGMVILVDTIAILVLGGLAFVPLLLTLPQQLGIETFCLFDGPSTRAADAFLIGFALAIITTGIGLIAFVAIRTERVGRWWWLIPPAWIATLIVAEGIVRLLIGPQPCQGSFSVF